MAITSAIMQMRRGLEADFDPDKMRPGEWAVSTDKKYVRMCFSVGVCVRMATYDAFEVDMAKIEEILEECQTIEEAVKLINSEVSDKLNAVIEYTNQAKQYRDEAEQFRNEAFSATPDGYEKLVKNVTENTVKIDTIIEKAELNIKNNASGEELHLTDSADSKAVSFGLYGKAEQKQYSGKNLLPNMATSQTINGITFIVNEDGSVSCSGTATAMAELTLSSTLNITGEYILSGCPSGGGNKTYRLFVKTDGTTYFNNDGGEIKITPTSYIDYARIQISSGQTVSNLVFYPMICLATNTDSTYEPYVGGIPSPNQEYPQEITVAGSDGSVEVVSCGKNLLDNTATTQTINGVTFTVNTDKSVTVNGTSTSAINYSVNSGFVLPKGKYIFSQGGSLSNSGLYIANINGASDWFYANAKGKEFEVTMQSTIICKFYIPSGVTANNVVIYPMIRPAFDTDSTYEPYRAEPTVSTISTPNGLAGIKVSSGGNYTDENGQQWICDEVVKYADGSGEYVQRIGIDTLGNYDYTASVFNGDIYAFVSAQPISNALFSNSSKLLCEKFTASGTGANNTMYVTGTGNIRCFTSSYTTAEEFKTAMSNSKLYYELAEPIITDLSAEEIAEIEKLYTFYPITNISNDAECGMEVTYIADSKNYIDGQLAIQKAQQEEALATMLLLMPEEVQASMIENDTNNLLNESEV